VIIGDHEIFHLDFHRYPERIKDRTVALFLSDPPTGALHRMHETDQKPDYAFISWTCNRKLTEGGTIALIHSPPLSTEIEIDHRKYFSKTFSLYLQKPSAMAKAKDRPKPDIDVVSVFHRIGSKQDDHNFNWEIDAEVGQPYTRKNMNLNNSTMTTKKRRVDINESGLRYPSSLIQVVNRPAMTKKEKEGVSHPMQKDLSAIMRLIRLLSNPGDIVLDPYMGSGTTMVAAERTGRRGLGFEIDLKYFNEAAKRIQSEVTSNNQKQGDHDERY